MVLYRIAKDEYIDDLSGEGAKIYGGRWNRIGVAALYTSSTRSLALLEMLVHFNNRQALNQNFSFLTIEIPDISIAILDPNELQGPVMEQPQAVLIKLAEKYFFEQNYLALVVPSAVIAQESNIVINTTHPLAAQIQKVEKQKIKLDSRFVNLF